MNKTKYTISEHTPASSNNGDCPCFFRSDEISMININGCLFNWIVGNSEIVIVLTDDKQKIIYTNNAFEKITGYKREDVLGKTPSILKSGRTPEQTYEDMNNTIYSGCIWHGEFINLNNEGKEFIEDVRITPLLDSKGEIKYFLAEKKDITAQKNAEKKIKQIAMHDGLTGLPNWRHFKEKSKFIFSESQENNQSISLLLADLNSFKEINDIYGHLVGDQVLRRVAKRFRGVIQGNDFIARIGGDEFVIIHFNSTEQSTKNLAKKISDSLNRPIFINEFTFQLSISIGSSTWPHDAKSFSRLTACADLAMYKAKSKGLHHVKFNTKDAEQYYHEIDLAKRLKEAIKDDKLHMVYQPKFNTDTKNMSGAEALLRWDDDKHGFVSPAIFIQLAEKYHLMYSLGLWVLNSTLKTLNTWNSMGKYLNGRLSINISIHQLENPVFFGDAIDIFNKNGIHPKDIEFEVTESVFISNPNVVMSAISKFQKYGISFSIDDFGTGYSSLSYLNSIKASVVKIDKLFINDAIQNISNQMIVKSIIDIGHNLGMKVVAEGVETQEQLDLLTHFGCDLIQGYFFSKPVLANQLFSTK